ASVPIPATLPPFCRDGSSSVSASVSLFRLSWPPVPPGFDRIRPPPAAPSSRWVAKSVPSLASPSSLSFSARPPPRQAISITSSTSGGGPAFSPFFPLVHHFLSPQGERPRSAQ